ncbi:MAG: GtrA family protein [Clostridia bacterium]|nr:GtrA family protein [Clostridia bacterium]
MSVIKKLWNFAFHTEKGLYLVFGALTTFVSLVAFYGSMWIYPNYWVATVLRNVAGILFAYFTNRGMVFGSTAKGNEKALEFFKFVSSRLVTFALDLLMMFVMVDIMGINELIAGLLSMVVVIILNYVLSKVFVFKKK